MNLDDRTIKLIAKTVAKEINKKPKNEEYVHKDWRLRNTKLLLKNYQLLVRHCNGITEDLEMYENITFDPEELNLQSLMKYKAKTKKMLDYFDSIWRSYHHYCEQKGGNVYRRFNVIRKLYIDKGNMRIIDVAELYGVDESTIRRDEKKATQELSIFLFGIDSLEELTNAVFVP